MPKNDRTTRRWTGWTSRKPSVLRPFPGLAFEQLEDRVTPTTYSWSGASAGATANNNWSNPTNWFGGVAPSGPTALTVSTTQQGGAATSEIQTISVPDQEGTFRLASTLATGLSGNLFNAQSATLQADLQAAFNTIAPFGFGAGNTAVSVGASSGGARLVTVTFQGGLANTDVPQTTGTFTPDIDLDFGNLGARRTNFNDLVGLVVDRITIGGAGYTLNEDPNPASNAITLGTGQPSSGAITVAAGLLNDTVVSIPMTLAQNGDQSLTVNSGSRLLLTGTLSGPAVNNLNKDGVGRMILTADNQNLLGGVKVNQGILEIRHVRALGSTGAETVVSANAGLYLNNVATVPGQLTVDEPLRLNGGGLVANEGALFNQSGNTVWSGQITLETGVTKSPSGGNPGTVIGAEVNTVLTITGVVTDTLSGMGLMKEGQGEVKLASPTGNTYRGQTNINNGALTITSAKALGDSTPGSGAFFDPGRGTFINQTSGREGQLRLEAPVGAGASYGFTVLGEYLVLNSDGLDGKGAMYNVRGDNTWAGPVILGSVGTDGADVTIGVAAATPAVPPSTPAVPSSLTISGVVSDPDRVGAVLTKNGGGRLILTNANTYRGTTNISAGTLDIRDSQALGPAGTSAGTNVAEDAALELDVEAGYDPAVVPRFDDLGRDTWNDSITTDSQRLEINEAITLAGRGVGSTARGVSIFSPNASSPGTGVTPFQSSGGTGALRSVTGINRWLSTVTLAAGGSTQEAAIGVEPDGNTTITNVPTARNRPAHPTPDSSYWTADYSLTVVGAISGGRAIDFVKRGAGQLILPNANPYFGRTLIEEGWVTVQNNRSLGDSAPNIALGDYAQQPTIVSSGASLHIRPPAPGVQITLLEANLVLAGIGPLHPYSFISQKGALVNLGGDNTVVSDIGLVNTYPGASTGTYPTQGAGIGVEDVDVAALGSSTLTVTGDLSDGIIQDSRSQSIIYRYTPAYGTLTNPEQSRLITVTAVSGRISVPFDMTGDDPDRLDIYYPRRGLPGSQKIWSSGGPIAGVGFATANFGTPTPGAANQLQIEIVVNEGGGTFTNPLAIGWQVGALQISDTPRGIVTQSPGALVKLGSKALRLQGAGSQTGGQSTPATRLSAPAAGRNEVREGILVVQNDTALGRATTGTETTQADYFLSATEVADGATLSLAQSVRANSGGIAAGVNIQDEQLILNEWGVQVRVAGQPSARFKLDFAGAQTEALSPPSAGVPAGYPSYAAYLQDKIRTQLPNLADSLVAGVPNATSADAAPVVAQTGPGVYTITFGGARFNNLLFSSLTAVIIPVGGAVGALAEVRISGSNAPLINGAPDAATTAPAADSAWRGPVTLNSGTRIEVRADSRLSILGNVTEPLDATGPSDLVKGDIGDLTLGGATSSYRGTTYIRAGIVTAVSSQAFGSSDGGTVVTNGAQIQLQGSLTISGEALTVSGNGSPITPTFDDTIRWLSYGPGATNNGVAAPYAGTGAPTAAKVTGISTDPTDPRIIYVATSGGGAWKTKDGGLTWIPLFDMAVQPDGTSVPQTRNAAAGATGTLLPFSAMMFGGQIYVAPSQPAVVYYATGDPNGQFSGSPEIRPTDNYAGSGVYRSSDSGKTWTRLLAADGSNPMYGQTVTKLIVDPFNADRIYVATSTVPASTLPPSNRNPATVPNGDPVNPRAGVWRYTTPPNALTPPPPAGAPPQDPGGWVDLTGIVSPRRAGGMVGSAPYDALPNGIGAPGTPGPDDDYRVQFPLGQAGVVQKGTDQAATWSDIQLVVRNTAQPQIGAVIANPLPTTIGYTLYAALGESTQRYFSQPATGTPTRATVTEGIFNGVYRTEDPDFNPAYKSGPTWWMGTGTLYPLLPAESGISNDVNVDKRPGDGYPVGLIPTPNPFVPPGRNGYIKIAAATVSSEAGPYGVTLDANNRIFTYSLAQLAGAVHAVINVYAESTVMENSLIRGELLDIRRSTNQGWTFQQVGPTNFISVQGLGNVRPFGMAEIDPTVPQNIRPALGRYDNTLIVNDRDPRTPLADNPNELILGGLDYVYRSTDGGSTWVRATTTPDDRGFLPGEQFHFLAWDTSDRLLVGSDAGLWRYDRYRWSNLNSDLRVVELNSVDPHPTDYQQAVGGASDNGIQQLNGAVSSVWQRRDDASTTPDFMYSGSNAGVVRYDPTNPLVIYAVRDGQLRKSIDGGANWTQINPAAAEFGTVGFTGGQENGGTARPFPIQVQGYAAYDLFPLVVDPLAPQRVLIGGSTYNPVTGAPINRLYESVDGGQNWVNLRTTGANNTFLNITPRVIALATYQGAYAPDPRFPNVIEGLPNTPDQGTIYVSNGSVIRVTKNRGNLWVDTNFVVPSETLNVNGTPTVVSGTITDIAVNPVNRDEVYATVTMRPGVSGGRVWRSLDAGRTWTDITGTFDPFPADSDRGPLPNIPVYKVVIDPRSGNLYVGTDNGVWQLTYDKTDLTAVGDTANVARTIDPTKLYWKRFGAGMPNVPVRDLELNQTTSTLTAATYGRGAYQMFLPDYVANSGVVRAVSGNSVWTGPVLMTGDTRLGAAGTQQIQNGLNAASIEFSGAISSQNDAPFTLEKVGRGTIILSGSNTYTGQTLVSEGVLEVRNPNALGAATAVGNTVVRPGAALQVRSDIESEPITVNGDGILFNGRPTGALRNVGGNNVYNGPLTLGTDLDLGDQTPPVADLNDPDQVTIGVDSGSTLRIGQNPASLVNPAGVGRVASSTNRVVTLSVATTPADIALLTSNNPAVTVTTVRNGSGTGPEMQRIVIPATAGFFTLTSPEAGTFGPFDASRTPQQLAADIAAAAQTRFTLYQAGSVVTAVGRQIGIDKELPGTLILSSDNTGYVGLTRVISGAVEVRDGQALGPAAQETAATRTEVTDGAAVRIASNGAVGTIVTSETLYLSGTGTPDGVSGSGTGALRNVGGNNTWQGPIKFTSTPGTNPPTNPGSMIAIGVTSQTDTLTVQAAGGITEDLATIGQFGLIKVGPGALRLANANQYTGVTEVRAGTVRAADNQALGATTSSNEVVVIRVSGQTTGGGASTFQLLLNGRLSTALNAGPLAAGATAAEVAFALEQIISGNAAVAGTASQPNVLVSETPNSNGRVYTVTFRGRFAAAGNQNVPLLQAVNATTGVNVSVDVAQDGGNGTIVYGAAANATSETQTVTVTGGGPGNFGAYTLTFPGNGKATGVLFRNPFGAGSSTAADVQAALQAASGQEDQNFIVTESAPGSGVFTVTATGRFAGQNFGLITVTPATLQSTVTGSSVTVTDGGTPTLFGSGATLELEGNGITVAEDVTINGGGVIEGTPPGIRHGALGSVGGTNTYTGTIRFGSATSLGAQPGATLFVSGRVVGLPTDPAATPNSTTAATAELTKLGAGVVVFPDAKQYRGRTEIAQGVLEIRNPGSLGVGQSEKQRLRVVSTGVANTDWFTLTLLGVTTDRINFNSPTIAADIQARIDALFPGLGTGNVVVSEVLPRVTPAPGERQELTFDITFQNALANTNLPLLTEVSPATPLSTAQTYPAPVNLPTTTLVQGVSGTPGANEVQTITVPWQGGTFTLNGVAGTFNFYVDQATLQAALTTAFGTSPRTGTEPAVPATRPNAEIQSVVVNPGNNSRTFTIMFRGDPPTVTNPTATGLGNTNVAQITGTFTPTAEVRAQAVEDGFGSEAQLVEVQGSSGFYQLQWTNPVTGITTTSTASLLFSATAADFQRVLTDTVVPGSANVSAGTGLGLGVGNVTVTRTTQAGGFLFLVQFSGNAAYTNNTTPFGLGNVNLLPVKVIPTAGSGVTAGNGTVTLQDGPEGTTVLAGATLRTRDLTSMDSETVTLNTDNTSAATSSVPALEMAVSTTPLVPLPGNIVGGTPAAAGGPVATTFWNAPLILGTTATIGVDDPNNRLVITQPITDRNPLSAPQSVNIGPTGVRGPNNNLGVTKVGSGFVEYRAAGNNDYFGLTDVRDGQLLLNHTGGNAVMGQLQVGDGLGAAQSAAVRLVQGNQIVDNPGVNPAVRVNADGLLDINGLTETIGTLTVLGGLATTNADGTGGVLNTGNVVIGSAGTPGGTVRVEDGGTFTGGTVTMTGGQFQVGTTGTPAATATVGNVTASAAAAISVAPNSTLNTGSIALDASTLSVGANGLVDTNGANVSAVNNSVITLADSVAGSPAVLDTVGATPTARGSLTLTDSDLAAGANTQTRVGVTTLNGTTAFPASEARFGDNALLDTGGTSTTLTNSRITGTTGVDLLTGLLTLTDSTVSLGTGPSALLNTGGQDITLVRSTLQTGGGGATVQARNLTASGTGPGSTVDLGADTQATFTGTVSLTDATLTARTSADITAGATTLTRTAAGFQDDAALNTTTGNLTLVNSTLTGTTGVDVTTQALSLDGSTLGLGDGPNATLNTNGQPITLANASALSVGNNATLLGGNLTATGNSTVQTGDSSTATLGTVNLTGGSLTTGASSTYQSGAVTTTGGAVGFGASSTNTVTGNILATNTTVSLGDGGTLGAQAVGLTNATLAVGGAAAAATITGLGLNAGHVTIAATGTVTDSGGVTATAAATASDITGGGLFRFSGGGSHTVNVADGTPAEDLVISSGLGAAGADTILKDGAGRLELAPVGTTFPNTLVVAAGDVQVDTATAAVQLNGATAGLSGEGTVASIAGPAGPAVGTVAPGANPSADPIGILTSTGDVTWGAGTTFFVNITGNPSGAAVAGVHNDQLVSSGNVVIGGAKIDGLVDTTDIKLNDRFTILRTVGGGSISGRFAETPANSGVVFVDGYKFQVDYSIAGEVSLVKIRATTATTLTGSGSPTTLNQPVTFTASVTAEAGSRVPPAGTTSVTFFDGVTPLATVPLTAAGTATLTVPGGAPALSGGTHTITAVYNGDPVNFGASTSNAVTQVVEVPRVTLLTVGPVAISPNASPGVQDTLALQAFVEQERSAFNYTVTVKNAGGTTVRTIGPVSVAAQAPGNTFTINTLWDGKDDAGAFVPDAGSPYQVRISIADVFTNTAQTGTIDVTVDNTLPTVTTPAVSNPVIYPGNPAPPPPDTTVFTAAAADANFKDWTVTVADAANPTVAVRTFTAQVPAVNATWDGKDGSGTPVPDGTYLITVVATDTAGNSSAPATRTVYVITQAPTVTVTTGSPTTYGNAVTLTATMSLPANVAGAASLFNNKPVTFSFPGVAGTLSGNLAPVAGSYQATVTVPLNLGAGTYGPITATFPATTDFLTATSAPVTHTVNPATLRVTAVDASRLYGDPNPTFTYTVNPADLKFTDTAAVVTGAPTTAATPASNAGTYAITQGTVSGLPNYTVAFTNGTLTVGKVPLSIQINDATRARFAPNPDFTATYTGFRLGDGPSVISGLSFATTATPGSPTGTYPITGSGTPVAANYTVTQVLPGNLTVTDSPAVTVVGAGGAPGQIKVLDQSGAVRQTIVYDSTFAGGVRTASGDFNRDGVADIVLATGPGTQAFVKVVDGATGATLFQAFPFGTFTGGAFVAAGDMTGDGVAELVVTPDEGGGPRVVIYRGGDFAPLISYFAIDDPNFFGGVRPAVGDMNNDGFADLAVSAGFGGGPRVSLWDGKKLLNTGGTIGNVEFVKLTSDFFVYEDTLRNGAFVAIGDVNGDGFGDLIAGAGPGGGPRVKIFSGSEILANGGDNTPYFANFFAGNPDNRGGVKVATKNLDGDKYIDVVTGGGLGDKAIATAYKGVFLAMNQTVPLYGIDIDGTLNGVFVG